MKIFEKIVETYPYKGNNPEKLEIIDNCVYSKFIPQYTITKTSIYLCIASHRILIYSTFKKSNYFKLK